MIFGFLNFLNVLRPLISDHFHLINEVFNGETFSQGKLSSLVDQVWYVYMISSRSPCEFSTDGFIRSIHPLNHGDMQEDEDPEIIREKARRVSRKQSYSHW